MRSVKPGTDARQTRASVDVWPHMVKLSHLKALVVDDNAHMRSLLRALLQSLGIPHIYEAPDGATGFKELCDKKLDIVFTDLSMTPMDGIEFTRKVRKSEEFPNPFI